MILLAAVVACGIQGSWADETPKGQYHKLTPKEQSQLVEQYHSESGERVDAPQAWVERIQKHPGLVQYSVVFVDNNGCITFRINITSEVK